MKTFFEIQKQADLLPEEERAGLAAHLLSTISSAPTGPNDEEVEKREFEMDSGSVAPISHEEFIKRVGRA